LVSFSNANLSLVASARLVESGLAYYDAISEWYVDELFRYWAHFYKVVDRLDARQTAFEYSAAACHPWTAGL
jgi:hypothetical protein